MTTLSDEVEGVVVDLPTRIGARVGTGMEIVATRSSGILPDPAAGTCDFAVAPMTGARAANLLRFEGFRFVAAETEPVEMPRGLADRSIAVNEGLVDRFPRAGVRSGDRLDGRGLRHQFRCRIGTPPREACTRTFREQIG
ncbi:hypothetical protein [uncultured Jannaschia sp.]|uniref:hypothetical protein n=1 Tax=uncultured Jannaschia sp. TaxID=293347 RepID=UPI0026048DF5|nr:hypothetical protein [uncultured Jannaschia sp.]